MDNKNFTYSYSAPDENERKEIESILYQYKDHALSPVSKYERLKSLDKKVKDASICSGLIAGVLGLLIFGLGITFILEWAIVWLGIILCVIGCVPIVLAYPIYNKVLSIQKEKYKDEIISLSEELLHQAEEREKENKQ